METNGLESTDLLQVLGSIVPLSAAYQERLRTQLRIEQYPPKHLLLKPGDICRKIYFISSGMVRIYSMDDMGRERTHIFMGPGELAVDVSSFYEQTPATEYLETLQETRIQALTWHELNTFYADFPEGNYVGRLITEKYLVMAVKRNMELLTASLHDRYTSLLAQYPNIEQQASQTQVASYLNVSRETLSRWKSEQLKTRH